MEQDGIRRPGRKRTAAAVLMAVLLLLLIGAWSQRKPIVRGFIDRELRARGVPARYMISELGLGRQRLTGLVIGDPAAPDLSADVVELRIGYGFDWPSLRTVTARGVRLRGRVVDGALSLGSVDRLLPAPGGAPFALPDLDMDLADTRVRLETAAGSVMLAVTGRGNLSDGFAGRLGASAPRLASGGCAMEAPSAALALRIVDRQPRLTGPLQAVRVACAGVTAMQPRAAVAVTLAEALTPLSARVRFSGDSLVRDTARAGPWRGQLDFDGGDARNRHGAFRFAADQARVPQGTARTLALDGRYRIGGAVSLAAARARPVRIDGGVTVSGLALAPAQLRVAGDLAGSGAATPLAPLIAALAGAVVRAGRDLDATAGIAFDGDLVTRAAGTTITGNILLSAFDSRSRSGARVRLARGEGVRLALSSGAIEGNGQLDLGGGGLPVARVTLRQAEGVLTGEAIVAPYAAAGARLALAPVRFGRDKNGLTIATTATIDGPLGDGRVTGLSLPIIARLDKAFAVNPACVPLRFATLAIAGVRLGATQLPLCPIGGAMLRVAGGVTSGGMLVAGPRLVGRVGTQPLTIAARDLRVDIGTPGFTADALAVRLGGAAGTRLDVDRLAGRVDRGGVGGRFGGAAGRIANVPLLLSGGEGDWRLAGGRLGLAGKLQVADAVSAPRFLPLTAPDVTLDLSGGVIRAGGTLREPRSGLAISNVRLTHDLSTGTGGATLDVPGITFGPAFQPEALTPLTLGIVANVVGTVNGRGVIGWTPEGVTSSGDFATNGVDLAAAFGPVTGIKTAIHFSDLLALQTPPGQLATIAQMNPGVLVTGGEVGYQLLAGQRVAVGGGKWPFFGGALILEPTMLDFGQPVERRMTFRVEGMDAAQFIAQFEFKNIAATGAFDGSLPMIFDQKGGRIEGGRLVVRKGGGTLAYVGELTNADLGTFGKLAFDALKAIRYDNLAIELDGALDSEIVSKILFTGTNENPVAGAKAKGLLKNLTGLPFKFNIVVRAPFRGLTSSASAFVNPGSLLGNAAKPGETPAPAVQPPLSENKR